MNTHDIRLNVISLDFCDDLADDDEDEDEQSQHDKAKHGKIESKAQ